MILCDIGNTSVDVCTSGSLKKYALEAFAPEAYDQTVYYISVNRHFSERIKSHPKWINIEEWVDRSKYYATMGIDRIMVCEAIENGVIVDAGSAITVDVMKDGVYCGGFISLGIRSAQKAYEELSPALAIPFNFEVDLTIMAKNTPDAVTFGYFSPLIQSIRAINAPIYLTGGDARILSKWLVDATVDPELIFKGMKNIIAKGNVC